MQTIKHHSAFNARTQKSRMSAGWSQDSTHFHFQRQHDSRAPFVETNKPDGFVDALCGVIALAVLLILFLFIGAY